MNEKVVTSNIPITSLVADGVVRTQLTVCAAGSNHRESIADSAPLLRDLPYILPTSVFLLATLMLENLYRLQRPAIVRKAQVRT